jgi:O6-methylguanine-DNA--protein-cysteine methyltransferase
MTWSYKYFASPVGKLKLVASETGLIAILWENENPRRVPLKDLLEDNEQPILVETERQLKEYFAGKRCGVHYWRYHLAKHSAMARSRNSSGNPMRAGLSGPRMGATLFRSLFHVIG